jgi:hypothetical protein
MAKFNINLDTKPNLNRLRDENKEAYKEIVSTFVDLMEVAAEKSWHKLPEQIHSSFTFNDVVTGVLNAIMTTREIEPKAYLALEDDLHPLALISDKRKDLITDEPEYFNWRNHFSLASNEVSRETLEKIIRKMLYLVRWFDIDTVSKSLMTNSFPIIDTKDVAKLPFQPALKYQEQHLGELHVGKFLHDIGAFNCGGLVDQYDENICPACNIGELKYVSVNNKDYHVCPSCNAGFTMDGGN